MTNQPNFETKEDVIEYITSKVESQLESDFEVNTDYSNGCSVYLTFNKLDDEGEYLINEGIKIRFSDHQQRYDADWSFDNDEIPFDHSEMYFDDQNEGDYCDDGISENWAGYSIEHWRLDNVVDAAVAKVKQIFADRIS